MAEIASRFRESKIVSGIDQKKGETQKRTGTRKFISPLNSRLRNIFMQIN